MTIVSRKIFSPIEEKQVSDTKIILQRLTMLYPLNEKDSFFKLILKKVILPINKIEQQKAAGEYNQFNPINLFCFLYKCFSWI